MLLFLSADIPIPIVNENTIAAVTSTIGDNGIVNIGSSIPASGSPICDATLGSMKDGNINDATINANVPATIVDP